MLSYILAIICIALMVLSLMLIILTLPGTWVILGIAGLWGFFADAPGFTLGFFLLLAGLAVFGEIVDFLAGYVGAKKYGGSNKGSIGGMIGALAGAILAAPFLFGFGALLGALAGSFVGCYLAEILTGHTQQAAIQAAKGATLGRFGGLVVKLGIGISMIWLSADRMWSGIGAIVA